VTSRSSEVNFTKNYTLLFLPLCHCVGALSNSSELFTISGSHKKFMMIYSCVPVRRAGGALAADVIFSPFKLHYYVLNRREGGNKRCFCPSVCLSLRPSVAYITNNSTTKRPNVPKFGTKVPNLKCNSHTSFKDKRQSTDGGGIPCRPNPAAALLVY